MAWIKVEHTLPSKPEVYMIASELCRTRAEVVGHLISLWTWVDQNSENGTIQANREMIDDLTTAQMANALVCQGWLHFTNDGKTAEFVNYDKHNGQTAKKRAMTANRVAKARATAGLKSKSNAIGVTREEKKRKEKEKETWTK